LVAVASRFIEWFWLRAAERAARTELGTPSPRALELIGRAALASEVAARTERPPEPFAHAGSEAIAAELYREAAHWALLAHAELKGARAGESDDAGASAADTSVDVLFDRADQALLARAAGGEEERDRLRADLRGSYREFAELEPSARRGLVERLERAFQALFEPLGTLQRKLERIWVRRVLHVLGVLVCAGLVLVSVRQLMRIQQRQHDYAVGAPWTVSSRYPQGGCESPRQDCGGGENYFFHTSQEQDPWVMFDLGRERRISMVEIDNRLDCCTERTTPVAIDVSTDKKKWREVARHTGDFTTLRESFDSVRARYVKIHIPAPNSILHLSHVRIFP
jgi:N-acetylgalactosamine 4-sulfate 6-O-sulfotransferase